MLKPTTVRVSDDFLSELLKFVKDMKLDKSAYLREILKRGFQEDKEDRLLSKYQRGDLTIEETCRKLGLPQWDFFALLKRKNIDLNVTLEDWLDSAKLQ